MTKKEKAIKDINVDVLKANFRTVYLISVFAALVFGVIAGYFITITVIGDMQSSFIENVKAAASVSKQ